MNHALEIRHHNAITTARYEYSELQMDLFFYLLSKLRKDDSSGIYEIVVRDLSTVTGKKYAYNYLRKATEAMGSRMFEVLTDKSYKQLWMFQHIEYITGEGRIEIKLSESIRPYLFDLKNNFTTFELLSALRLTSKHAKRIYTLCSQWKDLGETKLFDLVEFKRMLSLIDDKGKEEYTEISMFKKKVLDVAVTQINEHTNLNISYTLEKEGRAFRSILFHVKMQAVSTVATLPDLTTSGQSLPGVPTHQVENAGRLLAQLSITAPELVTNILSNPAHVTQCNKFAHDLKTGKHTKVKSPSGFLLAMLGLKKASNGPLFEAKSPSEV
jgi:plasmid replication initiation protein